MTCEVESLLFFGRRTKGGTSPSRQLVVYLSSR